MSPALVGFLRGLGAVVVFAAVGFFTNGANLSPLLGGSTAAIVAALALALEHVLSPNGTALAGSVTVRPY